MNEMELNKPKKIFISHSSQDLAYVQPLVELFRHIGLNEKNIFCSSIPGYRIPLGKNIFSYLKEQFQNYDLRVIFVLSENYYSSPASLNEMGAAWVLQHRYTSILLPNFDFSDIKGVIDQMEISIKLDLKEDDLKPFLNELRRMLVSEFGIKEISDASQDIWESHRNEFIKKITSMEMKWKRLRTLREKNRPFEEWVKPLQMIIDENPYSYDAMYMLGTIYVELDDLENAKKYLDKIVKSSNDNELKEKANKSLFNLGYTI